MIHLCRKVVTSSMSISIFVLNSCVLLCRSVPIFFFLRTEYFFNLNPRQSWGHSWSFSGHCWSATKWPLLILYQSNLQCLCRIMVLISRWKKFHLVFKFLADSTVFHGIWDRGFRILWFKIRFGDQIGDQIRGFRGRGDQIGDQIRDRVGDVESYVTSTKQ